MACFSSMEACHLLDAQAEHSVNYPWSRDDYKGNRQPFLLRGSELHTSRGAAFLMWAKESEKLRAGFIFTLYSNESRPLWWKEVNSRWKSESYLLRWVDKRLIQEGWLHPHGDFSSGRHSSHSQSKTNHKTSSSLRGILQPVPNPEPGFSNKRSRHL